MQKCKLILHLCSSFQSADMSVGAACLEGTTPEGSVTGGIALGPRTSTSKYVPGGHYLRSNHETRSKRKYQRNYSSSIANVRHRVVLPQLCSPFCFTLFAIPIGTTIDLFSGFAYRQFTGLPSNWLSSYRWITKLTTPYCGTLHKP